MCVYIWILGSEGGAKSCSRVRFFQDFLLNKIIALGDATHSFSVYLKGCYFRGNTWWQSCAVVSLIDLRKEETH
jgi:hypothetical protein